MLHSCQYTLIIPFLYKDTSGSFKILFQSVRSLHLHVADVASDYNVKAGDIDMYVETALCGNDSNDLYQIPSFQYSEIIL